MDVIFFKNVTSEGSTCHSKSNVYGQPCDAIKTAFPNGIRIDYVLYKNKRGIQIERL